MARKVKDRFRDWNLLHKSVVMVIIAFFLSVTVWSIWVFDAAFELEQEVVIDHGTEAIWPWVFDPKKRTDWQGELVDVVPYVGAPDKAESTRLLFWKRGYKRWQSVERTKDVVPERLYATVYESDNDIRWLRVELIPEGPCRTRVRLNEIIGPKFYKDRFWFFTSNREAEKRLQISGAALQRWVGDTSGACAAAQ
ncbi:MAG: SRPBCC family protein [Alphaproteobacteria bacterium]|nr:SRPBCC family protein [Alphaproteobacteria bacterium]